MCELYSHDPPGFVAPRHVGSSRTGIEPVLPAMAPDYQGKSLLLCFLPEVLLFPHLTLRSVTHFELTSGHDLRLRVDVHFFQLDRECVCTSRCVDRCVWGGVHTHVLAATQRKLPNLRAHM